MNNEMDTKIERKRQRFPRRKIVSGASILAIAGCALYLFFRDSAASLTVERSRITVGSVEKGEFNDYIQVIGQAVPARMVYLDAIEGGKVEERLYEEGAVVRQGDVILRLSNPLLNIGILQSEADLAYQENELRNTRIRMEQERLSLKQERIGMWKEYLMRKRRCEQCRKLMNEALIAREEYLRANEAFDAIHQQLATLDERIRQDSLFRLAQVSSLDENIRHMKQSLVLIRRRLENLKVKAPINGQVGNLDAQIGQSIAPGEHIGQMITPDLKIQAQIDEHYVERVVARQPADFTRDGNAYRLEVTKVYPEVKAGQFRTDLAFTSSRPENIRAGQTYHLNLQLGAPTQALLLPRGSFFQRTGGRWIYVLDKSGTFALRREIKTGRQNPRYYEILSGLEEGEEVIVSGYESFGDYEKIKLTF